MHLLTAHALASGFLALQDLSVAQLRTLLASEGSWAFAGGSLSILTQAGDLSGSTQKS